jgi:hypothetical protein
MVEEIARIGLEVVDVQNPSAIGDGDSELVFFIAFPQEWQEPAIAGLAKFF